MDGPTAPDQGADTLGTPAAESRGGVGGDSSPYRAPNEPSSATAGPAAVERLWEDLQSLRLEFCRLAVARRDQIKLALRRACLLTLIATLAIVVLAMLVASAAVMFVLGIAGGVGELLGGRLWLGQLLTGLGLLLGGGLAGFLLVRFVQKRSRRMTMERYGKTDR